MSEEPDIIEELRESYAKMGPIRKVVRTQFGIASGNTRKKAVPEWDEKTIEVENYYHHLKLMAADNIQEEKKPEWWSEVLAKAAEELKKQDVEKGKIVSRLEEDFPLSKRSIYRYLPQEFKDQSKVEAGRKGGEVAATVAAETREVKAETGVREPTSYPGPSQSEGRKSEYTDAEITLAKYLGKAGVKFKTQEPFLREGELTSEGKTKSYTVDVLAEGFLGLECEGAGTSSDSEKRDQFFREQGITIVHLPNKMVLDYGDVVAKLVALIIQRRA